MAKFCPECGSKIEENYKFCPECGFNISETGNPKTEGEAKKINSKREEKNLAATLICENCGEENDPLNEICSGCGAKLKNAQIDQKKTLQKNENVEAPRRPKAKAHTGKRNPQKNSNTKTTAQAAVKKKLDGIRIITIIFVGIGIAVIILFLSGVFDSVKVPNEEAGIGQSQSSGVNLNNINQINNLEAQIKSNPKDTAAILQLAHLKNDSHMFEQAIVNYKEYLALVPNDPDARIDMGICYYNLQNYKTAIAEMEEALKYDPKHQIGYLDLGIVNLTAGNFEKSRENLKKAVELDPNSEYGKKAEELLKSHENTTKMNGGK